MLIDPKIEVAEHELAALVRDRRVLARNHHIPGKAVACAWYLGQTPRIGDWGIRALWRGPLTISCRLPDERESGWVSVDVRTKQGRYSEMRRALMCMLDKLPIGEPTIEAFPSADGRVVDLLDFHHVTYDPDDIADYCPGKWQAALDELFPQAYQSFTARRARIDRLVRNTMAESFGFVIVDTLAITA